MKKILLAALLSTCVAVPAVAAEINGSAGVNFSANGTFGVQGEFSNPAVTNNAPVSVQVFFKNYSQDVATNVTWDTTGVGVAAIYDFNSLAKLDKKIHPYVGLGVMSVFYSWSGRGPAPMYDGVASGFYLTEGVRYSVTPKVAADLNYNFFGELTVGINYSF